MPEISSNFTPLMRQYLEIKNRFQDTLLLFQVGDFYELFFEDAKKAASVLGIALTKRGNVNGEPIPLCGVPIHVIDHHLPKLIKKGFKIAICNQLEEPVPGKVVRRGVIQVLTPSMLTDSKLLNEKSASYLISFFPTNENWGIIISELLTAQLFATLIPSQGFKILETELTRFFPDEILIPNNKSGKQLENFFKQLGYFVTIQDIDNEAHIFAKAAIKNFFNYELIYKNESLLFALYNFVIYLRKNQEVALNQFKKINFYKPDDFLILDSATQKNLELIKNNNDGSNRNSLFELLDKAATSMGSRMIKKWIVRPLIKPELIYVRQNAIEYLIKNVLVKDKLISLFKELTDLERIVGRIALKKAQMNDYLMLANALKFIPQIKEILKKIISNEMFSNIESKLMDFDDLKNLLFKSLNDDITKNWIVKPKYDQKLDKLRELAENSNKKILELENKEQQSTGISSLKIRYNQIYGYYIEITKSNLGLVPQNYIKQQTLSGKERFITPQLQQLQAEIENARSEINFVEQTIFENIKNEVTKYLIQLRRASNALASLDAIIGFSNVSYENGYIKPIFNHHQDILIEDGRHPIVEQFGKDKFIPNSIDLTNEKSLLIITGPNMGGKSTYLRQVALICLMAQCGIFVPAKSANLPILDRIFTRIGAGDNLSEGKSTFLVEMEETANICNQATGKSLVILDEVGRGTSTFDGLAIAQAVVEHIYKNIKSKCLFATHYHELTALQNQFTGIAAYYAASKKTENGILFLHKIIKGTADSSFGIEVAKLANLPTDLINRAQEILIELNNQRSNLSSVEKNDCQILKLESKFNENNKIVSLLSKVDFDELSPKKALDLLWEVKKFLPN